MNEYEGEIEINGGLEPIHGGSEWRVFAGSALTRHAAPPDHVRLSDEAARSLAHLASKVGAAEFGAALPGSLAPWWGSLGDGEREAVRRGFAGMWQRFGDRW